MVKGLQFFKAFVEFYSVPLGKPPDPDANLTRGEAAQLVSQFSELANE